MKRLLTFSGKYGDILFSLPTVREFAELYNESMYFACMPQYRNLLPLLNQQEYIEKAFVIEEWECTGSPHGDQPWESPNFPGREEYDEVIDLTYRNHPSGKCLMDWISDGYFQFPNWRVENKNPLPFIQVKNLAIGSSEPIIAYAFNPIHEMKKLLFIEELKQLIGKPEWFLDITTYDWELAAATLDAAKLFIGCRSSNYVLACGLNKKRIIFEPEPARGRNFLGGVFVCPYGTEVEVSSAKEAVEAMEIVVRTESRKCD